MIGQVQTKDGQKIVVPISGSIPTGNPVGSLLITYKKIQPRNYLYCDGRDTTGTAIELETHYPALYLYLGNNVLPDYRECVMVGAEKNTTDVFDSTETDPNTGNAGMQNHDVYAQGEFKDDQIQNITGSVSCGSEGLFNGTLMRPSRRLSSKDFVFRVHYCFSPLAIVNPMPSNVSSKFVRKFAHA